MFENPERQTSKKLDKKCSENSRSQIVVRTDIFRKLTLGAPDYVIKVTLHYLMFVSLASRFILPWNLFIVFKPKHKKKFQQTNESAIRVWCKWCKWINRTIGWRWDEHVMSTGLESWCFTRLRLGKHQDSRENKTNWFPEGSDIKCFVIFID